MTNFVIRSVRYANHKRTEVLGTLHTQDKSTATALAQAIGEIQCDKGASIQSEVYVRIFLPMYGKVDVRPADLKAVAAHINEEANAIGDWWQA